MASSTCAYNARSHLLTNGAEESAIEHDKFPGSSTSYVSITSLDNARQGLGGPQHRRKSLEQSPADVIQPLASIWWIYLLSIGNFGVGGSWAL